MDTDFKQRLDEYAKNNYCKYCGYVGLRVEWRLRAKAPGTYSIAGMHPKVVAEEWPWMICDGCKHESEGKR